MDTSEKKILSPKRYPTHNNIGVLWFIKYRVADYHTGKFISKKYYGALNLIKDLDERIALANSYIEMMIRGDKLPSYQGMKQLKAPQHSTNFANVVNCCYTAVRNKRLELAAKTISQYESRINTFSDWLAKNQLQDKAIGAITREDARAFIVHLKEDRGLSNQTCNDYHILFGWIWNEYIMDNKIQYNPWKGFKHLPDHTEHHESFPDLLKKLIRDEMPGFDPDLWLFSQCIYYCGIRPHGELRLMKVKDFDYFNQRFIVRKEIAKGSIHKKLQREIQIPDTLFKQLEQKNIRNYDSEFYLFSKDGKPGPEPVRLNYYTDKWNKFKTAYKVDKKYKLYAFKHTGGKELSIKHGEYTTQEHFGHKNAKSTRHYTEGLPTGRLSFLRTSYPTF